MARRSAERAPRADVALPEVGRSGVPDAAAGRRSRWQRYVDAAVLAPAHGDYGGPEAASRVRGGGKAVPEVRRVQLGGSTPPRHSAQRPVGSAAPRGESVTGDITGHRAGRPSAHRAGRFAGHLDGHPIGHLGWRLLPRPARDTALRRSLMDRKGRTDLRLVLPALMVWGTAIAGNWWPPAELAALCAGMAAAAGILLFLAGRTKAGPVKAGRGSSGRETAGRGSVRRGSRLRPTAPAQLSRDSGRSPAPVRRGGRACRRRGVPAA